MVSKDNDNYIFSKKSENINFKETINIENKFPFYNNDIFKQKKYPFNNISFTNNSIFNNLNKKKEELNKQKNSNFKNKYISDDKKRYLTFTKRKKGVMKKVIELCMLTGSQALILLPEEKTNIIHTLSTYKFKKLCENDSFKENIKKLLDSPNLFKTDELAFYGIKKFSKDKENLFK